MKQNQFVKLNSQSWDQFEALCRLNDKQSLPVHFPNLYRKVCNDLVIARSRQYSPVLVERINELVQQGQNRLYLSRKNQFSDIWRIARTAFPRALYENRVMLLINLFAFFGLSLVIFCWVLIYPDDIYSFVGQAQVHDIEYMYASQNSTRSSADDVLMFGVYIYNNISIAFQMFAGGALFCVGALFSLLFNSFYFGAIAGHIVNVGFTENFFSFVITHGAFELTAIVIASAAGCQIGYSLLNPKEFTRGYALKRAAQKVLPLIVGVFLLLILAAFIEAFWSPRDIDANIKYAVGTLCWLLVIYRLYRGMRNGT